ncbi:unnamed protein product [Adineta ricciae]|uniref:General transcription factor TFIIB n=1 Tax=Adineta ricciae TaxID=249248 RepID=A0A815F9W3_ADIRI|nr:unnamed protein product [Adineta ricciae]
MQTLSCRFHPKSTLIEDWRAGDMICSECGLVVGDRMIDVSSEWRTFANDTDTKDMCRVGGPDNFLFDNNAFDTMITKGKGKAAVDEFGQQKYKTTSGQISSGDRALQDGYNIIRQMASRISLENRIVKGACLLYKKCHDAKCARGYEKEAIAATCIYISCRQGGMSRTIKEICGIAPGVSKVKIGRCFNKIKQELPNFTLHEAVDAKNLISRFCGRLELKNHRLIVKVSTHISERAKEICDIQSRAPESVVGAVIYMACAVVGEQKPLKDLGLTTGSAESTIRQVYKELSLKASQLLPTGPEFSSCSLRNLPKC